MPCAAKLNELQSSGGVSVRAGDVATHGEYAQLLRDSRIVISPLGYASPCAAKHTNMMWVAGCLHIM